MGFAVDFELTTRPVRDASAERLSTYGDTGAPRVDRAPISTQIFSGVWQP
jgi:hypothetical protein